MAVVRHGDGGPVLGLTAESTGFIQEFSCRELYDEAEAANHIGETIDFALFNKRWEGSFTLIEKSGASLPLTATAIALANCTEASKVILTERERKPEQKGYQKHSFSFKAWANITLA